ncbi:MAG: hypothetical protein R3F62_14110 [Planctomycetota bacterium]
MDGVRGWPSRAARGFCLAAVALLLVAWCARPDAQPDLYFHLACARWILEHGFPRHDVFLQGGAERAFVDPEWLFQLAVAALDALGGARLLGAAKGLAVLLLSWLVLRPIPGLARWALAIPFVVLAGPRFVVRPELVTFLVLAWHLGWRRAPAGRRLGAAAAVQVLWANAHGFALLGPALLGLRAAVAALGGRAWRGWAVAAGVLLGCCALTPYPLGTLGYLPRIALDALGRERLPIAELAAPWSAGWGQPLVLLLVGWCVLSLPLAWIGWRSGRLELDRAGAALALVVLGAPYARTLPLAALGLITLSGPGLALLARGLLRGARRDPAYVALGGLAFLLARATVDDRFHQNPQLDAPAGWGRVEFKAYPEALADWERDPPPEPLFNGFSAGHYLLFAGQRPYICGNLDLYPRSHFAAYRALLDGDPRALGARLSEAGFQSALLDPREHSPLLLEALVADPVWSVRYVGPKAWVFERGPRSSPPRRREPPFPDEARASSVLRGLTLLPRRGIHPRLRLHLARALPALGEGARGLELARGALALAPEDPVVLEAAAELERLFGDPQRAQELASRWVATALSAREAPPAGGVGHGPRRSSRGPRRLRRGPGPGPRPRDRAARAGEPPRSRRGRRGPGRPASGGGALWPRARASPGQLLPRQRSPARGRLPHRRALAPGEHGGRPCPRGRLGSAGGGALPGRGLRSRGGGLPALGRAGPRRRQLARPGRGPGARGGP